MASNSSLARRSAFSELSAGGGTGHIWRSRLFSAFVILFLGVAFGAFSAGLITGQAWYFLVPLALGIPAAILISTYPFATVLIWILVFPFVVRGDSAADHYIFWIVHRALIPASLGVVILSHALKTRKRTLRFGSAEIAMVLFVIFTVANILLLSQDRRDALVHFLDFLFVPFCMYWLVRLLAPGEEDLKRLLPIAVLTVIAQCSISFIGWVAPQMLPHGYGVVRERMTGTLANAAVYTTTLIFLSLLLFQYAMHSKSRSVRFVFLATVGLAFIGVFFCFSRGSWLGACFVCTGLLFLYPKVVIRSGILLLLVVVPILGTSLFSRETNFALERLKQADTAESRITGLVASLRMTQARPWFGWGYHNYDTYDNRFIIRIGNLPYKIRTSHNTFLTVAAEMGVIALFLYLYPTARWLLASLKAWRHMPRDGFWSRKMLVMLWLLMLHQFIVSNFMDMIRFNLFGTTIGWIALGLIASMVYPHLKPGYSIQGPAGGGS